jgi:hypothetical protein
VYVCVCMCVWGGVCLLDFSVTNVALVQTFGNLFLTNTLAYSMVAII